MMRSDNDINLFDSFVRGETPAIEKVYSLHYKPLCYFAERITGTKEDAQDLVTEAFIKMLNKRSEFQNLANVKSFLYLVTKNACLNLIKARSTHNKAHKQIKFLTEAGDENTNVIADEMLRLHVLQEIYAEIENLPPRQKDVFRMLFVESMDPRQIAESLQIDLHTVNRHKLLALSAIKTELLKKNLILALLYLIALFPTEKF